MIYPRFALMLSSIAISLASALLAGCQRDDVVGPRLVATQLAQAALQEQPSRRPVNTASRRMARELPEFGGAFIDSGFLNVYLTDLAAEGRARLTVQSELARQRRTLPLRFRLSEYTYDQLETFVDSITPFLGPPGVAYLFIHEPVNRVRIAYVLDETRARIDADIRRLALPRQAFILERGEYAKPTATNRLLTDHVRPLIAGLKIMVQGSNGLSGTLGAVVVRNGTKYLVIASHVADLTGNGGTGAAVHQGTSQVGTVYINPPFSHATFNCPSSPSTSRCRRSDAALVSISSGVAASFPNVAAPNGGPVTAVSRAHCSSTMRARSRSPTTE